MHSRDAWKRRYTHVVAIDALRITTHRLQFNESHLRRELNKVNSIKILYIPSSKYIHKIYN